MRLRPPVLLLAMLLALLALPAGAQAQRLQQDIVGHGIPAGPPDSRPPGFKLTPRDAIRVAESTPRVRRERAKAPGLLRVVSRPTYHGLLAHPRWQVTYGRGPTPTAEIHVDGRSGRVLESWGSPQAAWVLARGYDPPMGGRTFNAAWVILPLCLLFLAPFFDPRRPFRLLHLDLLMMLGFGVSHFFFNRGEVDLSTPLVYPFLGYLLVRLLLAGFRPRRAVGKVVPVLPVAALAVGLVLLVGFRIALVSTDSEVIDVGIASVIGADRVTHGFDLYTDNEAHGDTYGPVNYLAYIPFEQLFPYSDNTDVSGAAHSAGITFDLLTIVGLLMLGARMRRGREGKALGLAMAFAWTAYPYSTFVLQAGTNDGLVAMLLVFSLVALSSAPGRAGLLGLASAAKFAPLGLAPLFAAGTGVRRPGSVLRFAAVFVGVVALSVFAYLPDGGLREFWNATLGFQFGRVSPFSIWGLHQGLEPLKVVLSAATALLAVAVYFVPRTRDIRQVAALAGAVVIALQITVAHWFYFYLVWIAPLALAAVFAAYREPEERRDTSSAPSRLAASSPAGV